MVGYERTCIHIVRNVPRTCIHVVRSIKVKSLISLALAWAVLKICVQFHKGDITPFPFFLHVCLFSPVSDCSYVLYSIFPMYTIFFPFQTIILTRLNNSLPHFRINNNNIKTITNTGEVVARGRQIINKLN